eukprot:scaffold6336_cov112-Isochrysis_galbana.AAC.7
MNGGRVLIVIHAYNYCPPLRSNPSPTSHICPLQLLAEACVDHPHLSLLLGHLPEQLLKEVWLCARAEAPDQLAGAHTAAVRAEEGADIPQQPGGHRVGFRGLAGIGRRPGRRAAAARRRRLALPDALKQRRRADGRRAAVPRREEGAARCRGSPVATEPGHRLAERHPEPMLRPTGAVVAPGPRRNPPARRRARAILRRLTEGGGGTLRDPPGLNGRDARVAALARLNLALVVQGARQQVPPQETLQQGRLFELQATRRPRLHQLTIRRPIPLLSRAPNAAGRAAGCRVVLRLGVRRGVANAHVRRWRQQVSQVGPLQSFVLDRALGEHAVGQDCLEDLPLVDLLLEGAARHQPEDCDGALLPHAPSTLASLWGGRVGG